jgi:ribosomal protein S18 acetylase RimI-like enzyme
MTSNEDVSRWSRDAGPFHADGDDAGSRVSFVVQSAGDMDEIRDLFREYQSYLGIDLCFQNFEQELAGLPGKYASPRGALLTAKRNGALAGCVGMRPIDETHCEMKRLYVRADHRGLGLGRILAEKICDRARDSGYRSMWLDTFADLEAALKLYLSMGFEPMEPYYANPHEGAVYLRKLL